MNKNITLLPIFFMLLLLPTINVSSLEDQLPKEGKRPKIALVLEGGAAFGFAHVGVLKVLEEHRIPVDIVVGTSMGAAVGGLYSLGYNAGEIEDIILSINWDELIFESINSINDPYRTRAYRALNFYKATFDKNGFNLSPSFNTGRKMLYILDRLTLLQPSPALFDTFPRRFIAVTADIITGEQVILEKGSLADALRSSMGIPGIFTPFEIDNRMLVDGGIIDNLPVKVAIAAGADYIIAVDLAGGTIIDLLDLNGSSMDYINKSLKIMFRAGIKEQLKHADMVFNVNLEGFQAIDFKKASEIIDLGEETARALVPDLIALEQHLSQYDFEEAPISRLPFPVYEKILIEGCSLTEEKRIRKLFAPVIGNDDCVKEIIVAINTLEKSGMYEFVRVRSSSTASVPTLVVSLHKEKKPENSLGIGLEYEATYAGTTINMAGISANALFNDLIFKKSILSINVHLLDSPSLDIAFYQPFIKYFFIESYLSIRHEEKLFIQDSFINSMYQTGILEFGITSGLHPGKNIEISAGASHKWSYSNHLSPLIAGPVAPATFVVHMDFTLRKFDSPIFPTNGILFHIEYDQSFEYINSQRIFRTLLADLLYTPALNFPLSFTIGLKAGTDFSQTADDDTASPPNQKPNLTDRQFYPGPLTASEQTGSHIAGLGLEVKYQINWATRSTGFPFFVLLQASTGCVLQDIADMDDIISNSHWNAAVGSGIRINDGFGALFRVGTTCDFNTNPRFFLALDIGTTGSR